MTVCVSDTSLFHTPRKSFLYFLRRAPSFVYQMILAYHPVAVSGGSFLGWYGADAMCREMAEQRLGMEGFRVFLADQDLPLERVIPWPMMNVPVINLAVS